MKVIKNEHPPVIPEWPKRLKCHNCFSLLEVDKHDIQKAVSFEPPTDNGYNLDGYYCPCCGVFNAIDITKDKEIIELLTAFLHHYADRQKTYKDWKTEDVAKTFWTIWNKKDTTETRERI